MSDATTRIDLSDLVGIKFSRGGRDAARALDCAGVVLEVLRRMDIPPPRALEAPGSACGATAVDDGWRPVGTDAARARTAGRVIVSQGPMHCTEHVWVSLGDGTAATCLARKGFKIVTISDILEAKAVYAYFPESDRR